MRNFIKLFSKKDFIVFGFLFFSLFLYSLLEIFSIGLIPVLVQIIIDPLKINEFYYHPWLNNFLLNESKGHLLMISSLLIGSIFLINNLFLLFITWAYELKTKNWLTNLSHRFVKDSLNLSYENFIQADHAKMINIIVNEFDTIRMVIRTYFLILKESLILFFVCITFLYLSTVYFLLIFFGLLFISVIIFMNLKKQLKNSGARQQFIRGEQIKNLDTTFRGIKYIKVFDKVKYFSNVLFDLVRERNDIGARIQIIYILPKLIIEIILILFFLITCNFLFISLEGNPEQFITSLTVMGVIIVRLIPIYTNLNACFINLKFSSPVIKSIISYLIQGGYLTDKDKNINQTESISKPTIDLQAKFQSLKILNMCYKFKTELTDSFSIKDINFEIHRGEKIGIIGKTGSGKTTLVNCVLGLLKPDTGDIILNKDNSIFHDIQLWQKKISFVPQDIFLMDSNIYQNIALSNIINHEEKIKIDNILKVVRLDKFLGNLHLTLGNKASKISEGEKQRVGIARALFKNCEFLVLDETTSSLDVNTESRIMDSLKEQFKDMTILTIAHRLSTVEDYDKLILMDQGKPIKIGEPKIVIKHFIEKYK